MDYLVIYSHPNPKSFNHAIKEEVEKALTKAGRTFISRDLYALDFSPALTAQDFLAFKSGTPPADIKHEQEYIKRAGTIIFIHPVWWFAMPSMLKGYIDRVLSFGFAYGIENGKLKGLLSDKKVIVLCTTGQPQEVYQKGGFETAMRAAIDDGIFRFCGMNVLARTFFYAVPSVSQETRQQMLAQIAGMKF